MGKTRGYILHETDTLAVIATMESVNEKTGNMVQVWILHRHVDPVSAAKLGLDSANCGDCPHRGNPDEGRKRSCYVNLGQAPLSTFRAYQRGIYKRAVPSQFPVLFKGRKIRLGAYGDPCYIPQHIVAALVDVAVKHTGYTHQWRTNSWLREYVMASCDTLTDRRDAKAAGWRTFRVVKPNATKYQDEILCVSESHDIQCESCGLCNGAGSAKSIFIPVHGSGAKNAFTILQ